MSNDLIRALAGALPKDRVLTKASELLCYAYDATAGEAGRVSDAVVLPASTDEVARTVAAIVAGNVVPATLEFIDATTLRLVEEYLHAGLPTDAAALLLIEVDGPPEAVAREADFVE